MLTWTARWRPALRMTWRDLVTHKLRTAVVTVLVALPVAAAVVAATMAATIDYDAPNELYYLNGAAEARLEVTPYARVRVRIEDGRYTTASVPKALEQSGATRDPASVDVSGLLPTGSRVARVGSTEVLLATGGRIWADIVDLTDPLTHGYLGLEVTSGRAPTAPDEAAVSLPVADELGLLVDGHLRSGATLELADGDVSVVGLLPVDDDNETFNRLVLAPSSPYLARATAPDITGVDRDVPSAQYLVDLPDLSSQQARALHSSLAEVGVSSWMRDAALHPHSWGLQAPTPPPVDPAAAAVGALVVGIGLTEVLVLVGAAFAVSARRQSRALGLLVSSGGTPADVRRSVLATGVWIGLAGSVLGAAAGGGILFLGREPLGRLVDTPIYQYTVPIGSLVVVVVLGFASAVLAAAVPAWGVGRLTASQMLDGHIAAGRRAVRHRFRNPGLALLGAAVLGLVACGFWTSRCFATGGSQSPVPVLLGALCALTALGGTVLVLPWVVTIVGRSGGGRWLPWRLAARDATRNRARTTAAVLAIGAVTTGVVITGFGLTAQASVPPPPVPSSSPAGSAEVYLSTAQAADQNALRGLERTGAEVAGADGLVTWHVARDRERPVTDRQGGQVLVVDDAFLRLAGVDDAGREAFAAGEALVVNRRSTARGDTTELRIGNDRSAARTEVPAHVLQLPWRPSDATWISVAAAQRLGYDVRPAQTAWLTGGIDAAEVERLRLHGVEVWTEESWVQDRSGLALPLAGGALLLIALVVGMIVALAAAEGRDDAATLSAIGAPGWTRRATSAAHALLVGALGTGIGAMLGTLAGASLLQVFDAPGTPTPWTALGLLILGVPLLCAAVGWLVAPIHLTLTRRTA
ncbi:FtsX-like permease family protein [Nocardioides sp. 1609]|uniref:FtsX-like permease family protein n=1 Tax=Nocardioides sp. 1609 TaxID=2508327 RepID=UPI001070626B|nr:FtsX-like permease family protein [Nocardioides sp. 1609]